jgi:KaiC/GvpD/RAD55 family RecA-like ATPase
MSGLMEKKLNTSFSPQLPSGCFSVSDWKERKIPPKEKVLGNILSRTDRVMLYGATGIGKSHISSAMAYAIATGQNFLKWKVSCPRKVLIIDGEMSEQDLQERVIDMDLRQGPSQYRDNLVIMSRESIEREGETFEPLNTLEGQSRIDNAINAIKPEIVILDNYMTLTTGERMTDDGWQEIMPWILSFSRRDIMVILIHHTGKNGSTQFGSEAKLFQLNVVIQLSRIDNNEEDSPIAFRMKFEKSRSARPEHFDEFSDATIMLEDDQWVMANAQDKVKDLIHRYWRENQSLPKGERYSYARIADLAGCNKSYVGKIIPELEIAFGSAK